MKKILIAQELHKMLQQQNSFLNRSDVRIFSAASNDELLNLHRAERVDLIITHLDMPGMSTEQAASLIRGDAALRAVMVIMVCANSSKAIEQCSRCGASAVILRPVNPRLLLAKAQQLLDVSWRETYRVLLSIAMEGNSGDTAFFCRSRDISSTGMLIETEKMLTAGDRISCSFFLPDQTRIQASGEIVRTIEQPAGATVHQFGVKFSSLSPEGKRALETFVENKSLKTYQRAS